MDRTPLPNHGGSVSSSPLDASIHPRLPMAEVGLANKKAQIRGVLVGIAGGVASAFIASRALRLNQNQALLSGLLTGTGVSYVATRQVLTHNLSALEATRRPLVAGDSAAEGEMTALDLRSGQQVGFEAGVAGLHELRDPAASTRGDH